VTQVKWYLMARDRKKNQRFIASYLKRGAGSGGFIGSLWREGWVRGDGDWAGAL